MSHALQNEAHWIPDKPRDLPGALEHLREQLLDAGHPSSVVNGLTGWLFGKAIGAGDQTSGPTRARYRRILRELEASTPTGSDPVRVGAATRRVQAAHNHRGVGSVRSALARLAA